MSPPLLLIAAAASSLQTLARVLGELALGLPTPIVIAFSDALPLDTLVRLQRGTGLPAVVLGEEAVALEEGRLVVVPPDCDAIFSAHTLRAVRRAGPRSRTVASAAEAFRRHLIVAVLAGAGASFERDDLAAARYAGGIVLHEELLGVPRSPASAAEDLSVPAADLAGTIDELIAYDEETGFGERRALGRVLEELCEEIGIDFRQYKAPTIVRRVRRAMAAGGFTSLSQYADHLRVHPEGYARLVRTLLINVTEFFRDAALFDYIRDEVVPNLVRHARSDGRELRIWSAGCATGEEVYSLAILVAEALGPDLADFHVRIFGTDLDEEAISYGRQGVYPASALNDVPSELVTRYFTPRDSGFEVKKSIRNITVFGHHDLARRAPFPRIDLCLCRNVLIYFTKELQQRALQLFAFSLRDDGYLILGKSETTSPLPEYFRAVQRELKVYRRQGPRVLIPPSLIREGAPNGRERIAAALERNGGKERFERAIGAAERPTPSERLAEILLEAPVGLVVVNRRYDILAINQAARGFLNVHGVAIGEDLIHSATGIASAELRAQIDDGFRLDAAHEPREYAIVDPLDGSRHVLITCEPQRNDAGEQPANLALVLVDVSREVHRRSEIERHSEALAARVAELEAQNETLTARQRALTAANDELTAANSELRSINEHLLIAAEESDSAAEEIETLNEEMQATNEELETLNEELQATVEELNTTNDELQARSAEFQELAATREQQRALTVRERDRLRAALDAYEPAIAILDDDGAVLYQNGAYRRLLERGKATFLRDGSDETAGDPLQRARRGESFSERYRIVFADGTNADVVARARPYTGDDGVSGSLVTIERVGSG